MVKSSSIRTWETIVIYLISLLGLFVGCSLYFSPETFIKYADFSSPGVRTLAWMWAARQASIALMVGFSIFKKSIPMVQVSLGAYCLMNIQDALIGVSRNDYGLVSGATVFGVLSAFLIFNITRRSFASPKS